MTEGPMSGQVVNMGSTDAADVLDRDYGKPVYDEEPEEPKPEKSTRAKRVRQKRKAERATVPVETPEG